MITKNKTVEQQIKECVRKLLDEDAKFLNIRLSQRIGSDLSDALVFIENKYPELNKFIASSVNAEEVYNTVDCIAKSIQETFGKKSYK